MAASGIFSEITKLWMCLRHYASTGEFNALLGEVKSRLDSHSRSAKPAPKVNVSFRHFHPDHLFRVPYFRTDFRQYIAHRVLVPSENQPLGPGWPSGAARFTHLRYGRFAGLKQCRLIPATSETFGLPRELKTNLAGPVLVCHG